MLPPTSDPNDNHYQVLLTNSMISFPNVPLIPFQMVCPSSCCVLISERRLKEARRGITIDSHTNSSDDDDDDDHHNQNKKSNGDAPANPKDSKPTRSRKNASATGSSTAASSSAGNGSNDKNGKGKSKGIKLPTRGMYNERSGIYNRGLLTNITEVITPLFTNTTESNGSSRKARHK
jgi:hypothetical protein